MVERKIILVSEWLFSLLQCVLGSVCLFFFFMQLIQSTEVVTKFPT